MEKNVAYCYRYFFKKKDETLSCEIVTGSMNRHSEFMQVLRNDENIVSAYREYLHEVDFVFLGFTEPVKVDENAGGAEK